MKRTLSLLFVLVLAFAFVTEGFAQRSFGRGGSFGGGFGRSSGGFSRSSGGFGRSSGGFFGGGSTRSYSRPSAPSSSGPGRAGASFGRSGAFGNSGRVNSSSVNPNRNYGSSSAGGRSTIIYGGQPYYSGGGFWSGYALGTLTNPWTHWVPFHPGFYVNRPYYDSYGGYHEGGFSFTRLILGVLVVAFVVWLVVRLFKGTSGGGNYRYTNYR